MDFKKIFENNQRWVDEKLSGDKDYFKNLAKGQNPDILYIGCSDSRVTAEDMIGAQPGELFVHRNIANVVSNTDISAMAVIKYAVTHLQVTDIIVCGHYGCGGVKAAMVAEDLGILNPWLRNIRDVYRLHHDELDTIADLDARYRRLIELNVLEQSVNVLTTPGVQEAFRSGSLAMHGWVFDMETGHIIDLKFDYAKILDEIKEIYRLS
ncbi:MAG: carbonic anhydrase [Pirellulaceae bacterium]